MREDNTGLGASVRVLARDSGRAAQAVAQTRGSAGVGDADVRPEACDISSLDALRAFVERFLAQEERLDVLVNNAGVMPPGCLSMACCHC